jgi:anti-anti-sigma factor
MSSQPRRHRSRADRRRRDDGVPEGRDRRASVVPPVVVNFHNVLDGPIVELINPLVIGNCFDVRDRLEVYCKRFSAQRIVVDLAGVPYADTAGLGMLVEMKAQFMKRGKQLLVQNPTPRVREIIEYFDLDRSLLAEQ